MSSHLEQVQAMALGATALLPADASVSDISAVLVPIIRSTFPQATLAIRLTPLQNIERARLQFGAIFGAAARGEVVSRTSVDDSTASVMTAIVDGGIRQWLEVVWTYDDTTYQHCLLVTGLAAEFAASLQFARNDQQHLVRGALLHDLGKAKIPLAHWSKPGSGSIIGSIFRTRWRRSSIIWTRMGFDRATSFPSSAAATGCRRFSIAGARSRLALSYDTKTTLTPPAAKVRASYCCPRRYHICI